MLNRLLDQITLGQLISDSEDCWIKDSYLEFCNILSSPEFPCLFGRKSFSDKGLRFIFVGKLPSIMPLKQALDDYISFVKNTELKERLYNPLVVFFEESDFNNIEEEHKFCWNILQELHQADSHNWLESVPIDTNNPNWSYCYGGIELFINMSCPHHQYMKSRYLGNKIVFIINPRKNFDFIASSSTLKGRGIRKKIRERVAAYNNGYTPSELGFFGDLNSLEWKQYQLLEPNQNREPKCPFKVEKK